MTRNRAGATAIRLVLTAITSAVTTLGWAQSPPPAAAAPPPGSPTAAKAPDPSALPAPSPPSFRDWYNTYSIHPGAWAASLGLNFMYGRQTQTSVSGGGSTSTINDWRESMRLANSGFYIVSPLLLTGTAEVDLDLNQDKSGGMGESTSERGTVVGYALNAEFLPDKPLTSSVFASRTQRDVLQPFGGRMVGSNENLGAQFRLREDSLLNAWGYPWVQANLGFRKNHDHNTTTSFGHSQDSDDRSQTIEFNASKGFQTADLGVNYQISDQANQIFRQGNFRSQAAGLQYSLDFGPTLNRRLDASLTYLTRNGVAPSKTLTDTEHLHLDHFQNLSTDYGYGFTQQTVGGLRTTEQNAEASVTHQLYKNLNTSAGVNGSYSTLPDGSTNVVGAHLGEAYHHNLPGKGHFSVNWSGGYQVSTNNLADTHISVFDESHAAPDPFGAGIGFLLNRNFAVASSIVVTDVRGGGRIPTTAGVDYEIIEQNNQIKIVPLAGSVLIGPGDPLVVSYDYQTSAKLKYASKSTGYGAGIDYQWISVFFNDDRTTQEPVGDTTDSQFLLSTELKGVQVYLHGTVLSMVANAHADFEDYQSSTTAYRQHRLGSTLTWQARANIRMVFGLDANDSQYVVPDRHKNSTRSARVSLDWFTWSGWTHTGSVDWSNEKDTGYPAQTLIQAIARSSISVGRLSFTANLGLGKWVRDRNRSTNSSFDINVTRQLW